MGQIAKIIKNLVAKAGNNNLLSTAGVMYEVPGVFFADQQVYDKFNPDADDLPEALASWTESDRHAASLKWITRYGQGFATPWKQDLTVLPAISRVQTPDAALRGFLYGGERYIAPPQALLDEWGVVGALSFTDECDLRALWRLQVEIIQPWINAHAAKPSAVVPSSPPSPLPISPSSSPGPVVGVPTAPSPSSGVPVPPAVSPTTTTELTAANQQISTLKEQVATLLAVIGDVQGYLNSIKIPASGGGAPMKTLRAIEGRLAKVDI